MNCLKVSWIFFLCSAALFVKASMWGKEAFFISLALWTSESSSSGMHSETSAKEEEDVELAAMDPGDEYVEVMMVEGSEDVQKP